ncbi:MAG TPA: c-type cytochrome [Steroidobacteraceae bacterium]|nr:c-type cytochrome [Steroidobacteraceae bacterium]
MKRPTMKRLTNAIPELAMALALALASGNAGAGNDFDYCLLCHGANANGNYGIRAPKLSGMEPWYLARQLENFASGARGTPADDAPGHEMRPVGLRLKQEGAIDAAVKFIGKLESRRPAPTVTGDVAHGKELYQNCASCHGARGEGNPALQSPALAARSDWYLVTQLANYRKGLRGVDDRDTYGAQMRAIVATLPDDKAINDVVAYINTLK